MAVILSTYRLQFHKQFPLLAAAQLVPYLHKLGISHIYASPLLQTRAGSTHGYDVTDPLQLNQDLGTEEDLQTLCTALRQHGMGLILDIVPNHMALSAENPWWMEVLERGTRSPYARFFDLPGLEATSDVAAAAGKLVLPVLGTPLQELIEKGELALALNEHGVMLKYYDLRLPLALSSYQEIMERFAQKLLEAGNTEEDGMYKQLRAWQARLAELATHRETTGGATSSPERIHIDAEESREIEQIKADLYRAVEQRAQAHDPDKVQLLQVLDAINGRPDDLKKILEQQFYELTDLSTGLPRINYRRFFDINELGGMRVEDPEVFALTHQKILQWVEEGKIDGLRIDHIDGLAHPAAYLRRLHEELESRLSTHKEENGAREAYIIVEKILTGSENPPVEWPIAGTSGYETIHALRPVHVTREGLQLLEQIYEEFTGRSESFEGVIRTQKRKVLSYLFGAETANLAAQLHALVVVAECEFDLEAARRAIESFTVHLPLYRTYVDEMRISATDRAILEQTYRAAQDEVDGPARHALDLLHRVTLLEKIPQGQQAAWFAFVIRWQQYTGPAMAKGLEDTTFYIHMPLLALNEVGSGPDHEDLELDSLHAHNAYKHEHYPQGLCALSTHDTKRSEDARARLHVLSEIPDRWRDKLWSWHEANGKYRVTLEDAEVPDRNEEYMLYQTLLGELTLGGDTPRIAERMCQFATKALREAKIHSTWYEVNHDYEQAVHVFIHNVLQLENEVCIGDIQAFECELAFYGMLNSLAQLILKNTMPGVPDTFQGQEMWDFSLVDPDNRHKVNFGLRRRLLDELLENEQPDLLELMHSWRDGRIKMFVTQRTLVARRERPDVYLNGEYFPLKAEGPRAGNVFAFARRFDSQWEIICVPRQVTQLGDVNQWPTAAEIWRDSSLVLPADAPRVFRNRLTEEQIQASYSEETRRLYLRDIFARFPFGHLASA